MEIFGKGVFLTGPSGIGKSETALALIERGNFLIADDSVNFKLSDCSKKIMGSSPENLKNLLEVRGLGVLNMLHLLGEQVLKDQASLNLILHFVPFSFEQSNITHPFEPVYSQKELLGLSIPEITLFILPGRNTALIVETAVRYHQRYHQQLQNSQNNYKNTEIQTLCPLE